MNIDKLNPDIARSGAAQESKGAAESRPQPAQAPAQVQRVDQVEISDAGRALAEAEAGQVEQGLQAERIETLRQLVVGGKYDRPEVIAEVARRLQASGDLRAVLPE